MEDRKHDWRDQVGSLIGMLLPSNEMQPSWPLTTKSGLLLWVFAVRWLTDLQGIPQTGSLLADDSSEFFSISCAALALSSPKARLLFVNLENTAAKKTENAETS